MAVAAGVPMVPLMACHGAPHGAMDSYAKTWDAVRMPSYTMGGTMAMPRKSKIARKTPDEAAHAIWFQHSACTAGREEQ